MNYKTVYLHFDYDAIITCVGLLADKWRPARERQP